MLRGGKEAHFTNEAMTDILHEVLRGAGVEEAAVTSILDPDRSLVHTLLTLRGLIDLVIPRGGAGLIRSVVERVPFLSLKQEAESAIPMWIRMLIWQRRCPSL